MSEIHVPALGQHELEQAVVTDSKVDMILSGLLNPSQGMAKALARKVRNLESALQAAEKRIQELTRPVSDEEWTYRYDPDCDREYVLREDVDRLIQARASSVDRQEKE